MAEMTKRNHGMRFACPLCRNMLFDKVIKRKNMDDMTSPLVAFLVVFVIMFVLPGMAFGVLGYANDEDAKLIDIPYYGLYPLTLFVITPFCLIFEPFEHVSYMLFRELYDVEDIVYSEGSDILFCNMTDYDLLSIQ